MSQIYKTGDYFIVAPATAEAAGEIAGEFPGGSFRWLFVGNDFARKNSLAALLPDSSEFVHSGKAIRKIADELKTPYINYIGELSRYEKKPEWWYGLVSEKNPFTSTLFFNLCMTRLAIQTRDCVDSPTVLFVEDGLALDYVLERLGLIGASASLARVRRDCPSIIAAARSRRALASTYFRNMRAAKAAYPLLHSLEKPDKPVTLLFSYVFPGDFEGKGNFKNHHLGDLLDRLIAKGENVAVWPRVWGTGNEETLWKKLSAAGVPALPSETFITKGDIASFCARDVLPGATLEKTFPPFMGCDVTPLIINDMIKIYSSIREPQNRIFFSAIRRWKSAGLNIDKIIYPFENHSWERMMIVEGRKHFPAVKFVGAQHAQFPSLMLNYYISDTERVAAPLPDKIVSCGNIPAVILKSAGYDPASIIEGPAFRYQNLAKMDFNIIGVAPASDKIKLLVATPIEKSVSIELIETCVSALKKNESVEVLIKCHPAMRIDEIYPDGRELPENFTIVDQSIESLIKECRALLYSVTTTCLEALPFHIEIIHFAPQSCLDMDPLENAPEFKIDASTPEELLDAVKRISSDAKHVSNIEERRSFVKNYFGVADDESVERF